MKKVLLVLVIALALVGVMVVPALAKAQKVPLDPIGHDPGGGFVIFNDTSGPNNVRIQMSLKGAAPNTEYDVYVHLGAPDTYVATVKTNPKGNVNFHYSGSVTPRAQDHQVGLGLTRAGAAPVPPNWQFGTGLLDHSFK